MKMICIGLFCLIVGSCTANKTENGSLKIWYDEPANASVADDANGWRDDPEWLKALPLGNGSLGAMVFGDVNKERIQLNEESMWSGSYQESDNPEAAKNLPKIKELLFEGKYKEATELTNKTQVCVGAGSGRGNGANVPFGCFQTLGDLWIDFGGDGAYTDYHRELDLSSGVVRVSYTQNGVKFNREVFISYPDQVMVVKFSADTPRQLSFTCSMNRPERYRTFADNNQLVMTGSLADGKGGDGLSYMARLQAINVNGEVVCSDSTLTVADADEVTLFLTASTDYLQTYPIYKGREYEKITKENLKKVEHKRYDQLLSAHQDDYKSYFDRVKFRLGDAAQDTIPTDKRVAQFKQTKNDDHLYELMFQYGRYLLISSSRPGTLPANLQGIWANKIQTPWNGDYHTDINIEMNYWPAEVTNLSEMHEPMFSLINSLVAPGSATAKTQYGAKGWLVHPITNVWGYTAPGEAASWGMHTGASAWICQHIGEHYRFSGDKEFLKSMYPTLTGAVEFYMDWLSVDSKSGKLVSGPAVSPENTFIAPDGSKSQISMGPVHDQQVIWQLFDDYIMISEQLNVENEFVTKVSQAQKQLAQSQIGSDGRLMEWMEEFVEYEPGHRHMSHLFAVHPGSQINLTETPELAQAAIKSMNSRMENINGTIGWSSAWLISQYARLSQAEKSKESLDLVLTESLYPNLFTICPPFQIDANFGTTAGIAEMLVQSHVKDSSGNYIIHLLPSLPSAWKNGEIDGLKVRGGGEVCLKWSNGLLVAANMKVAHDGDYMVRYGDKIVMLAGLKSGEIKDIDVF